ncbi:hypothetical protein B0H19DRAFT_1185709 [Mycena capillaripes]|nr:hypothetical protein B0H19DRAFT_1185709 [Mycena capillaripes]
MMSSTARCLAAPAHHGAGPTMCPTPSTPSWPPILHLQPAIFLTFAPRTHGARFGGAITAYCPNAMSYVHSPNDSQNGPPPSQPHALKF